MLKSTWQVILENLTFRRPARTRRSQKSWNRQGVSFVQRLESRVVLAVAISDASIVEPASGQAQMVFTLTRTGNLANGLDVKFETQNGTAQAGVDYVAKSGIAHFAPGGNTTTIEVAVLSDSLVESPETFTVRLISFVEVPPKFFPGVTLGVNSQPTSVATADFNADGKPDLAVGHVSANSVSILLNRTAAGGTTADFAAKQDVEITSRPHAVSVGDFNGDGKPDIVTVNIYSNDAAVALNTTPAGSNTISFLTPVKFNVGSSPYDVKVADINGDGKKDIVAISNPNLVHVLLNTTPNGSTTPTFAPTQTFEGPQNPRSVTVADFNSDGKLDLAASGDAGQKASVFLNNTGVGSTTVAFHPKLDLTIGDLAHSITTGDVNGDSKPDLVISSFNDVNVSVFPNTTGQGATVPSFAPRLVLPTAKRPGGVIVADVTGDGRSDLVVTNQADGGNFISVFRNTTPPATAAPTFAQAVNFTTQLAPAALLERDFNADGKADLAVANNSGNSVTVLLNDGPRIADGTGVGTIRSNSAPVIGAFDGSITYTESQPPLILDSNATVTDADGGNLETGKLTVQLINNGQGTDRLEIRHQGFGAAQIGIDGSVVKFGGVTIGTFAGGAGTTALVITLNAASNATNVQALLRNITFRSLSENPVTTARVVRVTLTDGDGGTS
ncbi:MAG: hypothetical protein FJ267_01760, partial [Planctomycetes bacterium]|nr:hypothetical protein [Planctomycetota bacterium]